LIPEEQIGEIDTGKCPERMIPPSTQVHIVELKLFLACIELKFHLCEAIVVYGFQKLLTVALQERILAGDDIRA